MDEKYLTSSLIASDKRLLREIVVDGQRYQLEPLPDISERRNTQQEEESSPALDCNIPWIGAILASE